MQHSKYRILGLVGQGQFGRVFCASVPYRKNREMPGKEALPANQLVALKELSHQQAPTSEFLRELWFLITLQHPNIVTCRALEHTPTGRYLVMDYCEGGTLRNLLKQNRPLRLLEGLQLVIGVLAGLDYAHRRGVVHCDIKPENILLTLGAKGWLPRLSDFGIARRLPEIGGTRLHQEISPDATVGSPAYMAPERFYGLYSPMSDIYAVGILLFELLMGYRPFGGAPGDLMWAHLNQRFQIPETIPEPLQVILKKSLEKLPARRFASASQMAQALRLAMYDRSVRQRGDDVIPWGRSEEDFNNTEFEDFTRFKLSSTLLPPLTVELETGLVVTAPEEKQEALDSGASVASEYSPPLLVANDSFLYAVNGKALSIWSQPEKPAFLGERPVHISLPEPAINLLPTQEGCCILTKEKIYWLNTNNWQLDCLLDLNTEGELSAYRVVVDPQGRWLAMMIHNELRFYSLRVPSPTEYNQKPLVLLKTLSVSEPNLPELIVLDNRHFLAIWSETNPKEPGTLLRAYTRRGTVVGSVQLAVNVGQAIKTPEPYKLIGIPTGLKPAVFLIHLWPLKVTRIPLDTTPLCASVTPWGSVFADDEGKILVCDPQGNLIGNVAGPAKPKTVTFWGKTGLVVATCSGEHSHIHFLNVEVETG